MIEKIKIESIEKFADLLHLTNEGLEKLKTKPRYKTFKIKKRNNKKREINAPSFELKIIQKWILINILEKEVVSNQSMAFVKGQNGIKENALIHKDNKYILSLDLKNFYPSITSNMVFRLFKSLDYSDNTAKILTEFCTYQDKLPQGGVTSPAISNLICKAFDSEILNYCNPRNILYSRYADDLTFSCDNKFLLVDAERDLKKIINTRSRFRINESKTRLLSPKSHKIVTGITVNHNELKVSKKIKQKIRATIHFLMKKGYFKDNEQKNQLIGNIAYVVSIENDFLEKCIYYVELQKSKFQAQDDFNLLDSLRKMKK